MRIVPAQQRLDALDAAGCDIDLRLIVQHELLLIECDAQLVLEREPLGNVAMHLQLIVQILLAGLFRLLQRRLGALHQGVTVLPIDGVPRQPGLEGSTDGTPFDVEDIAEHGALQQ